jgi:hypothetical protein
VPTFWLTSIKPHVNPPSTKGPPDHRLPPALHLKLHIPIINYCGGDNELLRLSMIHFSAWWVGVHSLLYTELLGDTSCDRICPADMERLASLRLANRDNAVHVLSWCALWFTVLLHTLDTLLHHCRTSDAA